jgi:hypothetical protein
MDRIKARLKDTSESWVAMILVVMNLVRLAKEAPYFWLRSIFRRLSEIIRKIIGEMKISRQPAFYTPKMSV